MRILDWWRAWRGPEVVSTDWWTGRRTVTPYGLRMILQSEGFAKTLEAIARIPVERPAHPTDSAVQNPEATP